ncbi:GTPase domain-containing protein [Aerosakkonemataceae cyanobacterium BLCC-F50]|uniref:GTPase domain-containing protein n=1 Tax=Floridaenema flaviceps BLCC-F50 TaxID=3153642 RepID=A0ABV4Y2L5_9CYAN
MEPFTIGLMLFSVVSSTLAIWATWEKIITTLKGKKIAVLGARGSGKTTFFILLNALNLTAVEIEQTVNRKKTKSSFIVLNIQEKTETIRFKDAVDLPGSEEYRDNGKWKEEFESANIVLYLVNAAALLRGIDKTDEINNKGNPDQIKFETKNRVKEDLKNLQKWINPLGEEKKGEEKKDEKKKKDIFIIGNHFDVIDENFYKNNKESKYHQEFSNNEAIKRNCQGMTIIIGSLKDKDSQKKLLEKVVQEMGK